MPAIISSQSRWKEGPWGPLGHLPLEILVVPVAKPSPLKDLMIFFLIFGPSAGTASKNCNNKKERQTNER